MEIKKVTIPYTPHRIQLKAHQDPARYLVLNWGRQTGKSTFAFNEVQQNALLKPRTRHWVVAPTYRQVKSIYWKDHIKRYLVNDLVKKLNESELSIEYLNGSFIEFKGADNPDSLRGPRLDSCVLDEYAFMKPFVYEKIIRPMLAISRGRVIFISTPNGVDNHFKELCDYAQSHEGWSYHHATSYDNPYMSREELEEIKKQEPEDVFRQEYLAEFVKKAGLVYKEFDDEIHVIPIYQPDPRWAKYISIDPGQTNPTAVLFIGVDSEDNIYIFDEIYQAEIRTSELANLIKAKMGREYFIASIIDAHAKETALNLSEKGIYTIPCEKQPGTTIEDWFKAGINKIREYLKIQEGTGKPKLFVGTHCQNTIREFKTYSWKEVKPGRENENKPERPQKSNDHCMDALRYFIYFHRFGDRRKKTNQENKKISYGYSFKT